MNILFLINFILFFALYISCVTLGFLFCFSKLLMEILVFILISLYKQNVKEFLDRCLLLLCLNKSAKKKKKRERKELYRESNFIAIAI